MARHTLFVYVDDNRPRRLTAAWEEAMAEYLNEKVSCSHCQDLVRAVNALVGTVPPSVLKRISRILGDYIVCYGLEGAFERLNGKSLATILNEHQHETQSKPLLSGQVGDVRYELYAVPDETQSDDLRSLEPHRQTPLPSQDRPTHEFEFIELKPGKVELGWRFDDVMPEEAVAAMTDFSFGRDFRTLFFSPRRTVSLCRFRIATTAAPWNALVDGRDFLRSDSLAEACRRFEAQLAKRGWRLPTEDEFEYAAGGGLFWWGDEIPDGIPYGNETSFTRHKEKTPRGLVLNDDPYNVEIVSTALKTGDGGVSICGGNDWPVAWLALSPSYRAPEEMIGGSLEGFLDSAMVRPVILSEST